MGYSGGISFNNRRLFSEWKEDGRFCMDYAEAYNKQKKAILSVESLEETIKQLHDGVTSYGHIMYDITKAGSIIHTLASLLRGGCDSYFDENGEFLLVVKMQNKDSYGNSQTINFYSPDRVSMVQEVEHHQRVSISEEDLEDMRRKRVAHIDTISIFSMFSDLENYPRKEYAEYISKVKDIKNTNDVLELISKANECYRKLNEMYEKRFSVSMSLTPLLNEFKEKISLGKTIYVRYCDDKLYFYEDDNEIEVEVFDFFSIVNLFESLGTNCYGSGVVIESIEDFETLIKGFESMETNHRSEYVESLLIEKYNQVKSSNEPFKLSISGSY